MRIFSLGSLGEEHSAYGVGENIPRAAPFRPTLTATPIMAPLFTAEPKVIPLVATAFTPSVATALPDPKELVDRGGPGGGDVIDGGGDVIDQMNEWKTDDHGYDLPQPQLEPITAAQQNSSPWAWILGGAAAMAVGGFFLFKLRKRR